MGHLTDDPPSFLRALKVLPGASGDLPGGSPESTSQGCSLNVILGRSLDVILGRPQDVRLRRNQDVRSGRPHDGEKRSLEDVLVAFEGDVFGTSWGTNHCANNAKMHG